MKVLAKVSSSSQTQQCSLSRKFYCMTVTLIMWVILTKDKSLLRTFLTEKKQRDNASGKIK